MGLSQPNPNDNYRSLLDKDPTLQQIRYEIHELKERRDKRIKEIQSNCDHNNLKEKRERLVGDGSWGTKHDLISKKCLDCGVVFERPKGKDIEICTSCWAPNVKFLGYEPGQGGGAHHYKCESCGHRFYHT